VGKQKTRGNLYDKVDRDLLHSYMWRNSDRNGRWIGRPGDLAEGLGVNAATMSTILTEMVQDGRLLRQAARYVVIDPALWAWSNKKPDQHPTIF
jgi:hypothetical protein